MCDEVYTNVILHYQKHSNIIVLENVFPSIVIASSPHPLVIFPAYFYPKSNCPLVYETRDLWPEATTVGRSWKVSSSHYAFGFTQIRRKGG